MFRKTLIGGPSLGRGRAMAAADDADRHLEFLMEIPGEGQRESREVSRRFRAAPAFLGTRPAAWIKRGTGVHRVFADRNIHFRFCQSGGQFAAPRLARKPVHVRLAGSEPNLANEQSFAGDTFTLGIRDRHLALFRRGCQRFEFHHPFALRVRSNRLALTGKSDGDLVARRSPAPHRNCHAALKHCVIDKWRGQFEQLLLHLDGCDRREP